jgi:AcrR family transcriptional regulator
MASDSPIRQQLLELAIQAIDEGGEPGIRISQLVEAAGVAIPTLYHHFGSREGLIEEAQAERFIRALRMDADVFTAGVATCKTKKDLVRVVRKLFADRKLAERAEVRWRRVNALGATYARPSLAERIVRAHDDIVTEIALALMPFQREGLIRQDIDLRAVIAWYNGSLLGKNLVEIAPSSIDLDQWDRTLDEATLYILFGPNV